MFFALQQYVLFEMRNLGYRHVENYIFRFLYTLISINILYYPGEFFF